MPSTFVFWKQPAGFKLPAATISRELLYGNDVEGLIDLPIKEILDRLKTEFPTAVERAGALTGKLAGGSFESSWSWQFIQVVCHDGTDEEQQKFCDILREFGCPAYEPALNLRHGE